MTLILFQNLINYLEMNELLKLQPWSHWPKEVLNPGKGQNFQPQFKDKFWS